MGISVKLTSPTTPAVEQAPVEVPPLSLEQLKTYWGEMLEAMKQDAPKLAEQLQDRELKNGVHTITFETTERQNDR